MTPVSTFLQIDLQNLFYEARNRGQKVDLEKIWNHFNSRENEFLTEAVVYLIRSDDFDNSKFEVKLKSIGYRVCAKNSVKVVRDNKSFYKQTNHDVGIVVDCMDKIDSFKKWVLMSGDGDFVDICKYLKRKEKKIEIWSFKESYNSALEQYADKVCFINEDFFYKKPKISVFGFNLEF